MKNVKTAWGSVVKVGVRTLKDDKNRGVVVVNFDKGTVHRSRKVYQIDAAKAKASALAEFIAHDSFPWKDTDGMDQWQKLPEKTLEM